MLFLTHWFCNAVSEKKPTAVKQKPSTLDDDQKSTFPEIEDDMDGDSYFFSYFSVLMCLVIVGYVAYHNRQKVLPYPVQAFYFMLFSIQI